MRDRWRRRNIGFVFQDFHLLPELTPLENVLLPATFERLVIDRAVRARASRCSIASRFPRRGGRRHALSRGEQQRLALARALLNDPAVILADEPTASLDAAAGAVVADALARLSTAEGRTVIAVTHDPVLISRCTRRAALDHGHVRAAQREELPA